MQPPTSPYTDRAIDGHLCPVGDAGWRKLRIPFVYHKKREFDQEENNL